MLVIGCGTVGFLLIQAIHVLQPACEIVAVAEFPWQAKMAHAFGAAHVFLARDDGFAEEIETLGAQSLRVDVTDASLVEAMVAQAMETFGRLDILVNNAGAVVGPSPVLQMAEDVWRKTLEINATGTFLCCKAALPVMIQGGRGGRSINMSSAAAKAPKPYLSAYAASKAAIVALTRSLAQEVAPFDITVNAVLPGDVDTAMKQWGFQLKSAVTGKPYDEVVTDAVAQIPLGRLETPQDVASLVAFLASDEASFISAQAYNVTGGRVRH